MASAALNSLQKLIGLEYGGQLLFPNQLFLFLVSRPFWANFVCRSRTHLRSVESLHLLQKINMADLRFHTQMPWNANFIGRFHYQCPWSAKRGLHSNEQLFIIILIWKNPEMTSRRVIVRLPNVMSSFHHNWNFLYMLLSAAKLRWKCTANEPKSDR